jgi:hypothetical protein
MFLAHGKALLSAEALFVIIRSNSGMPYFEFLAAMSLVIGAT